VAAEVHGWTGFLDEYTHMTGAETREPGLPETLSALLVSEACNVGLTPVADETYPPLSRARLNWVAHNYLRSATPAAGQHLTSDAVALGEQAQQKVLGADVGGAGSNGPVSTATASSFLNCPGVRCGTGWSSAWPERVVAVAGPLADLAASVSPGLPGVPGPLQLPG
jgi:hypothetical protein